jgi:hypothetical protein
MNAAGADIKRPRQNECDGESGQHEHDYEPRRPRRQCQHRKNRGGELDDEPADDAVAGRDAIDLAPA